MIRSFEDLGSLHVIVSNGAVTLEAFGQFGKFSNTDGFLMYKVNHWICTFAPGNLRLYSHFVNQAIPTGRDAISFQFFDRRGAAGFKVFLTFGGHDPSSELMQKYNELIAKFLKK